MNNNYPLAYAAFNNNCMVRMDSTSGGVFSVFGEYIICKYGGVVFGAAFDEKYEICHIEVNNVGELFRLRGSKYPQSKIGDTYKQIQKYLNIGRVVLFVGTPCQVVALKAFLNMTYDNLWCIDFVCHGVASPLIWNDYVAYLKRRGEIKKIAFKAKSHGWKKWYFQVVYADHVWQRRGTMTEIMKSYLEYTNIRPSCYNCQFKGMKRISDFTISDAWGVAENNLEINDDKGLSALLIHNKRAEKLFNEVSSDLTCVKYDAYELMKGNWTTFHSVRQNKNREAFFEMVRQKGTVYALKSYFGLSLKDHIKYYFWRLIGREK